MKPLTPKQALILRAAEGCSHLKADFSTGGTMDKTGYKNFLRDVEAFLFGNASEHMTQECCEGFFNHSRNFL
jgi:hypothetical protein